MLEWMFESYLWLKALHILAIIAWMAGLLYLPRLFAYHHRFSPGTEPFQTFCTMERRLLKIIMLPSLVASFVFGIALIVLVNPWHQGWFHIKLVALLLLLGYHGMLSRWAKGFAQGDKPYSEKFFRMMNEIPFLLAIIIVVMAVVKPF